MKKLVSMVVAAMFVATAAFAQVPQPNQSQQGTYPQQNQMTVPQPNQQQSTFPQQENNQPALPQQDQQQGTFPQPNQHQTIAPQEEEKQGTFPQQSGDNTTPVITDTTGKDTSTTGDTSGAYSPPRL